MVWFISILALLYYLVPDRKVWHLLRQPLIQSLFLGSALALSLLWQLQAQVPDFPAVHFLGLTTVTLLLGLRLTLLVIPLALLLSQIAPLLAGKIWIPNEQQLLHWCVLSLVAVQSYLCYLLISHKLPDHLFVSIFVTGFLNSLLSAVVYVGTLALGFFGVLALGSENQVSEFLTVMPLLAMPEALLNGMALTLLLVYRPHWVAAFRQM